MSFANCDEGRGSGLDSKERREKGKKWACWQYNWHLDDVIRQRFSQKKEMINFNDKLTFIYLKWGIKTMLKL